jgi:hypothetical protein
VSAGDCGAIRNGYLDAGVGWCGSDIIEVTGDF